ncbi:MAG: methyltransferase domain-containing protein [Bacteroidetes bacterium]|nr:methyltransferase domain-containing protein [Bacteroidota bacterium]
MNWFEEWFDSPYYHLLYRDRSVKEAENFIRKISNALPIHQGAKILDAACGKGRHSRTLAKLGFDVTGIDLSKNSIAFAKQFENEHLHFAIHDIRQIYGIKQFDFVVNLFSSFGYFEDNSEDLKVIKAFSGILKPGGSLMLDYINCEWAIKNMKPREIIQRSELQFHIQKKMEAGFVVKSIDFLADNENHHYQERLKVINLNRFEEMFTQAGFHLQQTFGDYELNKFIPSHSPRLILVAQKI